MGLTLKQIGTGKTWTSDGTKSSPGKTETKTPKAEQAPGETWTSASGRLTLTKSQPEGLSLPTLSESVKGKAKRPAAEAGRNQVEGLPSARSSAPYSLGTSLVSTGKKGLHAIAQAGGDALALGEDVILAPFELLSGQQMGDLSDSAPFNTLSRKVREESEATARKYQENMEKGGKAAERLENYGAATIAAVPNAVLAMLTGGGSAAAQTTAGVAKAAAAELTPGVTSTISRAVGSMAKNPQYWASFAQVVGGGYEDAIQEQREMEAQKALTAELSGTPYTGENENKIRTKAALYAVGNGLLNAAVEIGGGIETLPGELQAGGSAWRAFVDSMVDEGKEEVVQGVIERALKNPVYGAETPVFSTTDESAILNPRTAAEEFAGGVVVGGLLGGGQIGIAKAADANAARRTGKTLNGMDLSVEDVQAIVDEGLNSATDTAAYKLAVKAKAKLGQGKTLGNYELGRLYQANVDAVEHERVSLPFLEDEDPQETAEAAQEPAQDVLREGETQGPAQEETPPEGTQRAKEAAPETGAAKKPRMEMADFVNNESPVWNNVEYGDTDTQAAITQTVHKEMMDAGEVVQIPESTIRQTAEAYPDLRDMKKADRAPILREKMNQLKGSLRQFLNGLKGTNFEFEVNGNVLEARLYNTGIREVLEKINQDKASMLYHSDEIFRNAKYLYSTPDYSGDPNVYRWNYFYSPVQIGDETVGVRIAVRDMQRMTDGKMDSQIYNWGIKKTQPWAVEGGGESRDTTGASSAESPTGGASDMSLTGTTLDGDGRGKNRIPTDVSSVVPETNITQPEGKVNGEKPQKVRNGGFTDGERAGGTVSAETGTDIRAGLYAGRQGRVAGPGSAQQGSSVEKSAEARRRAEQSRLAVRRQSRVNALQTAPVSSREAGLSTGTEGRTIKIVPEEAYDDAMRSTAARYESHGYRVTYVIGLFTVETPAGAILINGAVEGDRIFIQADNRQWTIDQIGDHELFHTIAADSPGLVQEVREKIMEQYSEEEFEKVFAQYAKKYRGVYGDALAEDSVLGEQEIRDIMEEIFADAYGDKNAFGTNAGQFSAAVEETLEDRGLGRRGRETGEATDRTTGPPSSRYSYGGRYANRADSESLTEAERLEMQGLDPEDIRKETGWFRGMDGKWRFEIDDSGMEYSRWGDMNRTDRTEYARFRELEGKFIDGSITEAEQTELRGLIDQGHGSGRAEEQGLLKLSDFIHHDELFQNYPQLRKTGLVFRPLPEGTRGTYSPEQDVITISEDLRHAPEDTLIHEIQHAIQKAEGFAKGSSPEYWKQQRADITETIRAARENLDLWLNDIGYSEYTKSSIDEVISGKKTMDQHWKDLQAYKDQSKYAKQIARCEEELREYQKQYDSITRGMTPTEQYLNTAGEIEARDAAERRKLSPEERRLSLPDLGDEKTVFAEDDSGVYGDQGKTKFSMDETVEETRDLLAVHNMGEENLSWALGMGGLPMPSIAVIKADQGHSKYGPISIVFRKDTIDPQADKRNRVFGGDAWTQTNPEVNYPVNYEARRALEERIEELSQKIAGGMFRKGSAIAILGVDDVSGMNQGELAKKLSKQDVVKAAYLADQGQDLEAVMSEKQKQYDSFGNEALGMYVEKTGPQRLEQIYNALEEEQRLLNQVELQEVREALKDFWRTKTIFSRPPTEERLEMRAQKLNESRGAAFVKNAWEYIHDSGGAELEPDVSATRAAMEKIADEVSVQDWIEPQLEGILGEPGIRNTKDPFTPAGRSRSFEELHDPYTLEGIVKAMTDRQDRGDGVWYVDAKSVSSVATPEYKSVPEIKADSERLQTMDQEAYDMSLRELDQKIEDFKSDIAGNMSSVRETVGEALMEGAAGKRTDAALKRVFVKYGLGLNPKQAAAVREIYQAAASLPTGYFEAKPERVVRPDEWAMAVVPDDLSPTLRQKAEDSGLRLVEYKAGDDADRLRALNSKPELRFSVDEEELSSSGMEEQSKAFREKPEESGNLFRPEGMSDEEYNSLNQKWKEQKKKQRQKVRGDYQAELERRAAEAKDQRMKNVSKEDFTGTPALQRMGVKVENSVGIYKNIHALVESDKAAKSVRKEMRKAEKRLHATEAERNFASGIAAGVYSQEDIPRTMNEEKVLELADYFWAERAVSSDMIRQQRSEINKALAEKMGELFKDSDKFKPSRAIVLNNRTPERNMLRIFGDEQGAKINAAIFDPVAVNEAERYRFVNRMFDEVRAFEDSQGKKRPLTKEERALVQQVIEGRAVGEIVAGMEMSAAIQNAAENIRNGGDASDEAKTFSLNREQQRLAIQYARWMETREQLDSSNVDQVKVENAVKKYGDLFNQFYEGINDFLVAHGYEPIGFIKGYAPHLQPEENQNFLNKAFRSLGANADVTKLPASIAGRTAVYKPNKRWNPYFLSRNSDITKYDIAEAFESYVEYMSDVLYHTDDIMRVRQAANYFRRTYAPEEIRNNLEWAEGLREGTVEEKANFLRDNDVISKTTAMTEADVNRTMDEYVEKLYRDIASTTKYGELVSYLDNYANILAGKQSMADRGWEYSSGRTVLNLGNKLTRAFGKAQVAGNLSSAMNQTAQLPQIAAELGIKHTAKAIRDIAFGKLRKGGWALESDFLTGKKGIDYLVSDTSDMVLTAMFKPAELMDGMISTVAVRGKYLKEIQAGKTHREAMKAADDFGKKIMGSRMKGSRPLAFEAKNPVAQMMHIFQVEAVNQWEHLIQDLPRDFRLIEKEKGKNAAVRALAGVILKTLLAAFFLNRASEELYGGTPAPFDLLGLSANFVASGEGLTTNKWISSVIDNGWEEITGERLFNTEPEATLTPWDYENFDWGTAAADTGYNISNDIPYLRNAAGLLGLGDQTLPIPDLYGAGSDIVSAIAEDGPISWETGKSLGRAAAEVMPGGRQARKTAQGLETIVRGGKFKGYGDEARLQYPVDGDFFDVVQAMMFGGNGLEETRDFYASGDTGLSTKQTQVYNSLVKDGADRKEVYGTIQAYRSIGGDENISSYERGVQEREVIREADLTDRQKLKLYQGLTQADSRAEKFRAMMDAGLTWNQVTDIYNKYAELESDEELKASQQAAAFAKWVDGQGLSQKQAAEVKEQLKFYSIIPAKAERYETLSESGLDTEKAYQVTNALAELEPEDGKESVSNLQRYEAIANMPLSEGDKEIAMEAVMTESAFAKYEVAKGAGIKTSMYCDFLVEIGGMSGEDRQRQVWRYINGLSLNRRQKDALHLAAGYKESTLRDAPWN